MEILYFIGAVYLVYALVWTVRQVLKFLETRRYKKKLRKLAPQLNALDIPCLLSRLKEMKKTYDSLAAVLQDNHKLAIEAEGEKTIDDYVREEAAYRRTKRKPPKGDPWKHFVQSLRR